MAPERVPDRRLEIRVDADRARLHLVRTGVSLALRREQGRWRVAHSRVEGFFEAFGFRSHVTSRGREVYESVSGMILKVPWIPPEELPDVPGRKHEILQLIEPIGGARGKWGGPRAVGIGQNAAGGVGPWL